jgi:eIF-2B alpha/beta/delta-like uncharacterized protein
MAGSVEEKLSAISRDQKHGAGFLAREALAAFKLAVVKSEAETVESFLREMAKLGARLISLRPSMSAPIANAVVRAFDAISMAAGNARSVGDVKDTACKASDGLREVARENIQKTVLRASQAVPEQATILTHSYSETCLKALVSCAEKKITVLATESRPLFEGRKMAAGLKKGGVEVTLITDAEAGHFVRECQMVLVGADSVLSDGSVVNKMGTYLIALAAKDSDIPFHVACDSWKFRLEGGVPELEEKSAEELRSGLSGVRARNVYFDVTPGRLVTSIITEEGARSTAEIIAAARRWRGVLNGMLKIAGQHEKPRVPCRWRGMPRRGSKRTRCARGARLSFP